MFDPACLAYDEIAALYRDRFGASRVTVLLYEDLFDDTGRGLADLGITVDGGSTLAQRENAARRPLGTAVRRWSNVAVPVRSSLGPGLGSAHLAKPAVAASRIADRAPGSVHRALRERWAAEVERFCAGRYEASNAALAEVLGQDLGARGCAV